MFVTCAEGSEGTAMTLRLLALRGKTLGAVMAGVGSNSSAAALKLAAAGAKLRVLRQPPDPAAFAGATHLFLLAPLTADRLAVASSMADAARAGGSVQSVVVLSVVGSSPSCPASLRDYYQIEQHVQTTWPSSRFLVRCVLILRSSSSSILSMRILAASGRLRHAPHPIWPGPPSFQAGLPAHCGAGAPNHVLCSKLDALGRRRPENGGVPAPRGKRRRKLLRAALRR